MCWIDADKLKRKLRKEQICTNFDSERMYNETDILDIINSMPDARAGIADKIKTIADETLLHQECCLWDNFCEAIDKLFKKEGK